MSKIVNQSTNMHPKFNLYERVQLNRTNDQDLDGKYARLAGIGFESKTEIYYIVNLEVPRAIIGTASIYISSEYIDKITE